MQSPLKIGVWYPFGLEYVHDGDTVAGVVDLLDGNHYPTHVRLAGINAPELFGATAGAGGTAKSKLAELLGSGQLSVCSMVSHLDKFGRVIGWLKTASGEDVSALMLASEFAKPFMTRQSGLDPLAKPAVLPDRSAA